MPELTHLRVWLSILWTRLSDLRKEEDGYSTETAIVVALIGAVAIILATAIAAAIRRRVNTINGF
ncbi:MAG TPA: hypothetical protein VFA45_08285 [Actinomycetes bacterium]|jgi:hypothetical protein|nr:hypothetical protein [Actinomycetes bacterium]